MVFSNLCIFIWKTLVLCSLSRHYTEQGTAFPKKKKYRATNFPERGLLLLPTVNGGRVFKNTVIIITK